MLDMVDVLVVGFGVAVGVAYNVNHAHVRWVMRSFHVTSFLSLVV